MTDERRDDPERPRYVDRHRAQHIQGDRLNPRERTRDEDPRTASSDGNGLVRSLLARIARMLRGGGRSAGAVIAALALLAGACGDTTEPETAAPSPTGETASPATLSGSTTCEDPSGDVYATDPSQLPTDASDPNIHAADLPNVTVRASRGGIAIVLDRDDPGTPPTGRLQHTLWMQDDDGATGVVRATWHAGPGGAWDIEAGSDVDDLSPIEASGAEAERHRTVIPIARDALPVEPPFSWAVEVEIIGSGVADICPNVDPGSPLTDAGELPGFPEDEVLEAAGEPTVEIVGQSYAFAGVPEEADVGTRLTFRNGAEEPHELVLLRLDDEAPPVEEFVRLPREEGEQHVSELVGVSIAMPGQPGVMRQGALLLDDPGTYVLLCGFPTGVTADFIKENFGGPPEGPPPSEFGPPHVAQGMFASIEVGG